MSKNTLEALAHAERLIQAILAGEPLTVRMLPAFSQETLPGLEDYLPESEQAPCYEYILGGYDTAGD